MTRPSVAIGQKSALLAPTTTRFLPKRTASHWSKRSPAVMRECITATVSPNRLSNRDTVCGVSAISGTSTIAPRPNSSAWRIARRYTSVLPDPVTPSTTHTSPAQRSMHASTHASAAVCPSVSAKPSRASAASAISSSSGTGASASPFFFLRRAGFCSSHTSPRFTTFGARPTGVSKCTHELRGATYS